MNLQQILAATAYPTDKSQGYLENYEEFFRSLCDKEVKLLELGINYGGSLQMWRDYFPKGICAGLDLTPVTLDDPTGRIRVYQGMQQDTALLDRIAREVAPGGFDVIIDDCSHVRYLTAITFAHLFDKHLKSGGIYCIEDWGCGYWDSWADGKAYQEAVYDMQQHRFISHDHGMVGFIKTLVDECGMEDATKPGRGTPPPTRSKIKKLQISGGQVFIVKA